MQGAPRFVAVATELRRLGVQLRSEVLGDGPERDSMEREIVTVGLGEHMKLMGVLDFELELVPHLRAHTDIFVDGPRQGDPS